MKYNISIVIADDHEIFRDGLSLMLSKQQNLSVSGQAEDGEELIEVVEKVKPDIVLTDIKMPRMDGIEATKYISAHFPDIKIIAFSMFNEDNLVVDMLEAGAKG